MIDTMNVENPKVGLFYENNIPYLTIELGTEIKGEKANIKIHKIRLDKIDITTDVETIRWSDPAIPSKRLIRGTKITFDLKPVNKEGEIYSISVDTNKKKITKEEIEKKLGYEIEIVD